MLFRSQQDVGLGVRRLSQQMQSMNMIENVGSNNRKQLPTDMTTSGVSSSEHLGGGAPVMHHEGWMASSPNSGLFQQQQQVQPLTNNNHAEWSWQQQQQFSSATNDIDSSQPNRIN